MYSIQLQQVREKYTQNNAERLQKELNEIKGGREGFLLGLTNYKFFISKAEGDKNSASGLRISSRMSRGWFVGSS